MSVGNYGDGNWSLLVRILEKVFENNDSVRDFAYNNLYKGCMEICLVKSSLGVF